MNVVMRFCIEYINPRFPFLDNGNPNVRHYRAKDEETAESVLTIILSCGCKIVELYRGNVKDGKLAEWETPMIVDQEDWVSDKWLEELRIIKESGWHPASELPVIPEGKNWVKVVALVDFGNNTLRPRHKIYKDKGWSKKDMWTVKYWCYPPKEDNE